MDDSRKIDVQELKTLYAQTSNPDKRRAIENIIKKIYRETPAILMLRNELVAAIRSGDRLAVRKISERLRILDKMTFGIETQHV